MNPTSGEISLEVYMTESCIHQVIYQCWDLNENTDGQRDLDFIVDCCGPETTKEIGENLVKDGVANSEKEVNEVLMNGFFWLYGPVNNFI